MELLYQCYLWLSELKNIVCTEYGLRLVTSARLVVLESGLGLESGLKFVFAGLRLGLGLGL